MPNRAKRQREGKRENARWLKKNVGGFLQFGEWFYPKYLLGRHLDRVLFSTPFLDAMRKPETATGVMIQRGQPVPYGYGIHPELFRMQAQHQQVVEITRRHYTMSLTPIPEDVEALAPIRELIKKLEEEMQRAAFGGVDPWLTKIG